jgi:hypothetical protein
MYYVNLGLTAPYRPDGSSRTDWGLFGNGTSGGQRTCTVAGVTVYNVSSYLHHLGTEVVDCPTCAWLFHFGDGYQGYQRKDFPYFAWAVRDGDVAAIPLPSTATLFGVGGFLIWVSARR